MKLNIPEEVFNRRLERMVEFIRLGAPKIFIYHEARLIREALEHPAKYKLRMFFRSIRYWWQDLFVDLDELETLPENPYVREFFRPYWTSYGWKTTVEVFVTAKKAE